MFWIHKSWKYILVSDIDEKPHQPLVKDVFFSHIEAYLLFPFCVSLEFHDIFYSHERMSLLEIKIIKISDLKLKRWNVNIYFPHQSIKTSNQRDLFKGNCLSQCKSLGFRPSPPNPHIIHITTNTTPHPLNTASPQACQYRVVISPYRAKEGQAATRAAGAQPVRNVCCQASNNIWR